ncbi:Dps family protein [Streptomyces sp. NPDC057682]|uniref:Dps family protein n=1 Tax=Streptomyces sp. NPDC057682 TaxID=3346210 RepID=UPI003674DFE6
MRITATITDDQRKTAGQALQSALTDLQDLSLQSKQAHWTVVGGGFRSLHLHLDEIVESARTGADDVAERAAAIGVVPDGRPVTIAAAELPQLDLRYVPVNEVVTHMVNALAIITARFRENIIHTEAEPVTQDMLIGITTELEKHSWMLQAQQA